MSHPLEPHLSQWREAQLITDAQVQAIQAFEASRQTARGFGWPVLLALAMGALMLGAGVLLFVAAHWDAMSPSARFGLTLLLVAVFHVAAALVADKFHAMSVALHAVGTVALGAGIFLSGQIFHLQTDWYNGFLLWGVGAALGYALLKQWPQLLLAAALLPIWLFGEWEAQLAWHAHGVMACGALMLALTYFTSVRGVQNTATQTAISCLGGLALLPAALLVVILVAEKRMGRHDNTAWQEAGGGVLLNWALALGLPLLLAAWLRGKHVWLNGLAALWVLGLYGLSTNNALDRSFDLGLPLYAWSALGAIGLVAWGLFEAHKARINMGVAMFGMTVLAFYFSSLMDKLGRSLSLVGLGVVFLLGGWALEQLRRRLIARIGEQA